MSKIHGHEVLNMMLTSGKTYTRASLVADILIRFGVSARFHTCSAEDLTADELVTFLEAKGKFVPQADGFKTSSDLMCKH
ncbi:MAG TPA: YecH family metal-binding protein [Clostridia bacterium]|nr:YecH family metal-binding protein [Clostridia bacterium]